MLGIPATLAIHEVIKGIRSMVMEGASLINTCAAPGPYRYKAYTYIYIQDNVININEVY